MEAQLEPWPGQHALREPRIDAVAHGQLAAATLGVNSQASARGCQAEATSTWAKM